MSPYWLLSRFSKLNFWYFLGLSDSTSHGGKSAECRERTQHLKMTTYMGSKWRDTDFPCMASLPDRQNPHALVSKRKQQNQAKHSQEEVHPEPNTDNRVEYQAGRCPLMLRFHLLPTTTWVISLHCCPFAIYSSPNLSPLMLCLSNFSILVIIFLFW